jgi:hypothetical protein
VRHFGRRAGLFCRGRLYQSIHRFQLRFLECRPGNQCRFGVRELRSRQPDSNRFRSRRSRSLRSLRNGLPDVVRLTQTDANAFAGRNSTGNTIGRAVSTTNPRTNTVKFGGSNSSRVAPSGRPACRPSPRPALRPQPTRVYWDRRYTLRR